jgi:DNA-binding transcriptional ArsR family regulator
MVCCQEICVTELAARLGMKPQAVSNQLQRLVDRRIVSCRRNGNNIFYKFVDPCVQILLERGLCLIEDIRDAAAHGVVWRQRDAQAASLNQVNNEPSRPENEPGSQKGNI